MNHVSSGYFMQEVAPAPFSDHGPRMSLRYLDSLPEAAATKQAQWRKGRKMSRFEAKPEGKYKGSVLQKKH